MSFFSNFFKTAQKSNNKSFSSKRSLHMEPLEDRQMLSVTPVTGGTFTQEDFAPITTAHGELTFNDWNSYNGTGANDNNIVVLDAATATASDIVSKLADAVSSNGDDIIIFDTSNISIDSPQTITLTETLIIPSTTKGTITILTIGDGSLTLKGANNQRILSIVDSDVQIVGLTLQGTGTFSGDGGGIYFQDSENNNTLTISNVKFDANKATGQGGALYQSKGISKLYNVLLVGNHANNTGGAIAVHDFNASITVINSTFVENTTNSNVSIQQPTNGVTGILADIGSGSASNVNIQNSIFLSSKKDVYINNTGAGKKTFSNNLYTSITSIDLPDDTTTVDNEHGDANLDSNYRPTSESDLVIDKGDNVAATAAGLTVDLDGHKRIEGSSIDRGAYEYGLKALADSVTLNLNGNFADRGFIFDIDILANDDWSGKSDGVIPSVEIIGASSTGIRNSLSVNADDGTVIYDHNIMYHNGGVTSFWFDYQIGGENGPVARVEATITYDAVGGVIIVTDNDKNTPWDNDFSQLSIYEAVYLANVFSEINSIKIDKSITEIELPTFALIISSDVDISGSATFVASGTRIFEILGTPSNEITVSLSGGLTLTGGTAEGQTQQIGSGVHGGAIYAEYVNLTLEDVTIENSSAIDAGGAIYQLGGEAHYTDVTISSCSSDLATEYVSQWGGGAVYFDHVGVAEINASTFSDNIGLNGGAVYLNNTDLVVERTGFLDNSASQEITEGVFVGSGGAIYSNNSNLEVIIITFTGNTAISEGGAVAFERMSAGITGKFIDVEFIENNAGDFGGAIFNFNDSDSILIIENSTFTGNTANGHFWNGELRNGSGGAVYNVGSRVNISNSLFDHNTAFADGGAVFLNNIAAGSVLTNVTIADNTASGKGKGGGLFITTDGNATIQNSIIINNTADTDSNISGPIIGFNNLTTSTNWGTGSGTNYIYDPSRPLFVGGTDGSVDYYHLAQHSQAIDKGDNNRVVCDDKGNQLPALGGEDRIYNDGIVDVGAYESDYAIVPPTTENVNFAVAKDGNAADSITLTWNAQPTEVGLVDYNIYYKKSSETDWTLYPSTIVANAATVSGLDSSQSYDFYLKINGYDGTVTTNRIPAWTKPQTPELSSVVADTSITLTWTEQDRLTRYSLSYRKSGAETWTAIPNENGLPPDATTFTLDKLTPNTSYEFSLVALNEDSTFDATSETLTVTTNALQAIVVTNNGDDTPDANPFDNGITLREAIELVMSRYSDDLIEVTFADAITGIQLQDQLTIKSALTIDGTGVTLTAADNTRILTIDASGEDVTIIGLTFTDGHITKNGGYGGAIYQINGNVTLTDVTFENNYARMGGAYFQKAGTSAFVNATFTDNKIDYYGGAFYCYSGTASFTGTNFENNSAKWGGAIYLTNTGNITLTD
ncbi:MAG: fibronectin type III domain-containing protein, partial [Planctomycetaceae bacterium]|nr:fibronectin type III domain-containing protein [Planctomycetaceae bacterium]